MTAKPPTAEDGARRRGLLHRLRWLAPLALGLLGSVTGLVLFTSTQPQQAEPMTRSAVSTMVAQAIATAASAPARSAGVYQAILPSLVLIQTEGQTGGNGIGSGVVINEDATILTANHVIEGARRIRITFADGSEANATVVSNSIEEDLAVLMADGLPEIVVPAVLGGASPKIGDETFAVGNPLGLAASLSAGVVSGLNRTIPIPRTGRELNGLIQFDAAVNPGSSGGPLLNREGQVIGIVTALANPGGNSASFTGIGFAVPLGGAGGGPGGPPR